MPEFPPELKNFVDDAGRLKQWPSKRKLQLAAMPVGTMAAVGECTGTGCERTA